MNKKNEYLDSIFKGTGNLNDIAFYLKSLSVSLCQVGNQNLSDNIFRIAQSIEENSKNISDAVGNRINDDFNASQESINNTISAVLDANLRN